MKQTLSTSHAASLLTQDENANWTYAGATALVEYLEECEEATGEEMEFEVITIRCEWTQYESLYKWADDYFAGDSWMDACNLDKDEDHDDDEIDEAIRNYINNNGQLIEFDGGIIVSSF